MQARLIAFQNYAEKAFAVIAATGFWSPPRLLDVVSFFSPRYSMTNRQRDQCHANINPGHYGPQNTLIKIRGFEIIAKSKTHRNAVSMGLNVIPGYFSSASNRHRVSRDSTGRARDADFTQSTARSLPPSRISFGDARILAPNASLAFTST